MAVRRIDHLALLCKDVAANRGFAQDLLGLSLREQVVFNNGTTEIGAWLSPSAVHHQVAYVLDVRRGDARLHHFSFWVDEREDVLRAADILSENDIFIEAGPAKHNNSQGFYLYCHEPGGNRIEVYSGSFLVFAPDFEVVRWNEEERGCGVYWGGALPESFLTYATPDIPDAPVEFRAGVRSAIATHKFRPHADHLQGEVRHARPHLLDRQTSPRAVPSVGPQIMPPIASAARLTSGTWNSPAATPSRSNCDSTRSNCLRSTLISSSASCVRFFSSRK